MQNDIKLKLELAYEISSLYIRSMSSASVISDLTDIPFSSVKKFLNYFCDNIENYVVLFPKIGTREQLLELKEKLESIKQENITRNKWKTKNFSGLLLKDYNEDIKKIKDLYIKLSPVKDTTDLRKTVINLQVSGLSMKKIAEATGVSLGRVHKIITEEKNKLV